ncbi:MAG TPA: hypothetical protein VF265_07250, partial [Nevskiaceae bacterium]
MTQRTLKAWISGIGGGAILWALTVAVSGQREAWDSSLYWSVAYPLAICLAGGRGHWLPTRPWRWGIAVMLPQATILVLSAASFSLLPLGLIAFSVLALPAIAAAVFMARRRRRG